MLAPRRPRADYARCAEARSAQAGRSGRSPLSRLTRQPGAPGPGRARRPDGPVHRAGQAGASQTDWLKVCGKDPAAGKEICYTTRDFVSDQGQPVLAVAVYDVKGDATKMVRFLVPLGLLVQPGLRFATDQGKAEQGRFDICFPTGCFAQSPMKDDQIAAMKKGTTLNISVQNQFAREVTFQVPLAGFGKAYRRPARSIRRSWRSSRRSPAGPDAEAGRRDAQEAGAGRRPARRARSGPAPAPAPPSPEQGRPALQRNSGPVRPRFLRARPAGR